MMVLSWALALGTLRQRTYRAKTSALVVWARSYATPRGTATGTGVHPSLLRALPFLVSRQEADAAAATPHSRNPFLLPSRPSGNATVKETYVPFWLLQTTVVAAASQAQVGYRRAVVRRKANNQNVTEWETQWSSVFQPYMHTVTYTAEELDMQVPATLKFESLSLKPLRPGPLVGHLLTAVRPITDPGMLVNAASGEQRRVVPFQVTPAQAREQVEALIKSQQRQVAEAWYQQVYRADEVRLLDLQISFQDKLAFPLYIPVYVYSELMQRDQPLDLVVAAMLGKVALSPVKAYTLVSGVAPGAVTATRVYSERRVATSTALAVTLFLLVTGLHTLLSPGSLLLYGLVLPAVLSGVLARYAPEVSAATSLLRRGLTQAVSAVGTGVLRGLAQAVGLKVPVQGWGEREEGKARMEDEYVRAYQAQQRFHQQRQQQQQQQQSGYQQQQQQGSYSRQEYQQQQQQYQQQQRQQERQQHQHVDPRDFKGYYTALGVKPGAGLQEIQEAFRSLALQHHPDRFSTPADKERATKRFQAISEAYSVLRNPSKRAAYDAGMQQ